MKSSMRFALIVIAAAGVAPRLAGQTATVALDRIRTETLAYVATTLVPGRQPGVYYDTPGGNLTPSLYASCDVALIRAVMGEDLQRTLAPAQREGWIAHVNSFARPDGTYGPNRMGHTVEHANGMVIGALGVLGGRQQYPVQFYDTFDTPEKVSAWLEGVDWKKQWQGSHRFWGGMHCFSMSRRCTPAWRDTVFKWLDANLDADNGWWRTGVPQVWPQWLGGGAHIWPIYQHHNRRFPYPERVIDHILANQKPNGEWLAYGSYMELDALYGLVYMSSLAPDYRNADILQAARRHGNGLTGRWPGFIGAKPPLHVLLGAVGAFGLLQQLLPETYLADTRWSDIFSDTRFYQTAAVEAPAADGPSSQTMGIPDLLRRVNEWQTAHPVMKADDRNWERGTWYTGVMAAWKATGDERYLRQALAWGSRHQWQVGTEPAGANRLFCAETWTGLYLAKKDQTMIDPSIRWLNTPEKNSPAGAKVWYLEGGIRYADSLFGAPTLAMLAKATGDRKYLDTMHTFFWDVHGELFDPTSGLFYRDKRFIGKTTQNGRKIHWSRGNGWVISGIARILEHLPEDDPARPRYVELFQSMAAAIARAQGSDGLWRPNLSDPDDVPLPETSGTGFFCYAIAWGINHGLLDRGIYLPVANRAWSALANAVSPDGKVRWGQPVGDSPAALKSEQTHEYVTGAFMMAGSEMLQLVRAAAQAAPAWNPRSRDHDGL